MLWPPRWETWNSVATTWLQQGDSVAKASSNLTQCELEMLIMGMFKIAYQNLARPLFNMATTRRQHASTCRQRRKPPKFTHRGCQKRGTTWRPKRYTMTGAWLKNKLTQNLYLSGTGRADKRTGHRTENLHAPALIILTYLVHKNMKWSNYKCKKLKYFFK